MINEYKRIVIVGAQGTGKSTLVKKLVHYINLPVINEVPRSVAKMLNIDKNGQLLPTQRLEWQKGILWWQLALETTYNSFISDRSLIDHWAYSKFWLGKDLELLGTLCKIIPKQAQTYTHIIYLPPLLLPLQNDGFRSINLQYVKTIDEIIKEILEEWFNLNSKKIKIIKETQLDQRVKESLNFILGNFKE